MEVETETETSTVPVELVTALEQATLMAKQLPATTDPSQLLQILSTLHSVHHHLSHFLSHHHPPRPAPHHPQPVVHPNPPPENSVSSAVGGGVEENDETLGSEPMVMGDDDDEQNSRAGTSAAAAVEKVAGRMRECFIQNKRAKRRLSPSAAEQWRSFDNEGERDGTVGARLRCLIQSGPNRAGVFQDNELRDLMGLKNEFWGEIGMITHTTTNKVDSHEEASTDVFVLMRELQELLPFQF